MRDERTLIQLWITLRDRVDWFKVSLKQVNLAIKS